MADATFIPQKDILRHTSPAYGTDVEGTTIIGTARVAGSVSSVNFIPNAAITGADTNTRKLAIVNKGQAGAGTTEIAALQFNSGIDGVAFDAKPITLSATAADLEVVAGDVLAVVSTTPGSGIADPGGLWEVVISRSNPA